MRVQCPSEEIVDGLCDHHSSRHIRLAIKHRTSLAQQFNQRRVFLLWSIGPGDESQGGVVAFDLEVVLD